MMRYATLLALVGSVQAASICVDTPQKLRDAFVTSQNNGNANNLVMIVRGTYAAGGSRFAYDASASSSDGNLIVRGGYNADCSARLMNPALTVLDGGGLAGVMAVTGGVGSVTVEYLTVQNGKSDNALDVGSLHGDATARFNIVRNNQPSSVAAAALSVVSGGTTLHVDNNLVYGNDLGDGNGSLEIYSAGAVSYVTNNTVSGNTNGEIPDHVGGAYFSYLFTSSTPAVYFNNNIFYNNSSYGLFINGPTTTISHFSHNDIGNTNANVSCCANVDVPPQFVDSNNGNFRLAATSPLLGTGTTSPLGGLPLLDLDGNPRYFNGLVDLGAYERGDWIFVNGFDF